MSVKARQVNPLGNRVFMGTITDKLPIHDALASVIQANVITTATFELLGGIHQVEFSAYDFERQERGEPIIIERPMEIVAGHGTVSLLDDNIRIHLHMALSYRDATSPTGIRVVGGHVVQALAYAVEFTLTAYEGAPMHRAKHLSTGLNLWHIAE